MDVSYDEVVIYWTPLSNLVAPGLQGKEKFAQQIRGLYYMVNIQDKPDWSLDIN